MFIDRRCAICNNPATKFFVHAVEHLALNMTTPEDRMEGFYCNNCYATRMFSYANSLRPAPLECKYCGATGFMDAGHLQIHTDIAHSNPNEAGTTVLESPPVLDPRRGEKYAKSMEMLSKRMEEGYKRFEQEQEEEKDPVRMAQEILNEDSKKWAAEYVTPPIDTPISKAQELKKKFEKPTATELRKEWAKNKPPEIPPEKMLGLGPQAREAMKKARMGEDVRVPYDEEEGRELYVDHEGRFGRVERKKKDGGHLVLQCNECPATFNSRHGMANHRRAHQRDREREQKRRKRQTKAKKQ